MVETFEEIIKDGSYVWRICYYFSELVDNNQGDDEQDGLVF